MTRETYNKYHGVINSIKNDPANSDHKIITIRPEYPKNAPIKEYIVHDIFLQTTDDKFADRHVFVVEQTSWELFRIIVDDTYNKNIDQSGKREELFKYDIERYQEYKRISMSDIYTLFRRDITRSLNMPENVEYFKKIFAALPHHIKQYWNIELYAQNYMQNNYALSAYDSEKIHFFYWAYKAAYDIEKNNIQEYTDEEQVILNSWYDMYMSKVINVDEDLIAWDIYVWYVYRFIEEIKNAKKWYKTTVREKHISTMYDALSPVIRYYFLQGTPTYPISDKEYSTIVTLFHLQKILLAYEKFDDFAMILQDLSEVVYNHTKDLLDVWISQRLDMEWFVFDGEIHENDIFWSEWVHILLDQLFSWVADQIREEYGERHTLPYRHALDQHIHEELQETHRVYWFYYCVQLLDDVYKKCIENKTNNNIT